jgi:hypothetical protein
MTPFETLKRARRPLTVEQLAHGAGLSPIQMFQKIATDPMFDITKTTGGDITRYIVRLSAQGRVTK